MILEIVQKIYFLYGIITTVTFAIAIPVGITHEMIPTLGIDIGFDAYGKYLFGMGLIFVVWTLVMATISTEKVEYL